MGANPANGRDSYWFSVYSFQIKFGKDKASLVKNRLAFNKKEVKIEDKEIIA